MVTAAAALIIYRNKFLLAKRANGAWEFPKCYLTNRDTAFRALKKAVKTHFGIDILPYQRIKEFPCQNALGKGALVLIRCSVMSDWKAVMLDTSTHTEYAWPYILNTEALAFAPLDQQVIAFLRADTAVFPNKTHGPGLASLPRTRRRRIASMGGKAAHACGTAHTYTSEEAKRAGGIGGRSKGRKYKKVVVSSLMRNKSLRCIGRTKRKKSPLPKSASSCRSPAARCIGVLPNT